MLNLWGTGFHLAQWGSWHLAAQCEDSRGKRDSVLGTGLAHPKVSANGVIRGVTIMEGKPKHQEPVTLSTPPRASLGHSCRASQTARYSWGSPGNIPGGAGNPCTSCGSSGRVQPWGGGRRDQNRPRDLFVPQCPPLPGAKDLPGQCDNPCKPSGRFCAALLVLQVLPHLLCLGPRPLPSQPHQLSLRVGQ